MSARHDGRRRPCRADSRLSSAGLEVCGDRILLIGNPNVGKSVFFSRLTGVHALSSNYPGTTVGFTEGRLRRPGRCFRLIDVPGAYTLDPTNEAEEVARRIVDEGAALALIVVDATALERNLFLTLQTLERGIPSIIALNMVDEARHKGIIVDVQALERELGVPVVPTVAVSGQGIKEIVDRLGEARPSSFEPSGTDERWLRIGKIIGAVQRVEHRHHTFRDRMEDLSVDRHWGGVIGLSVLALSFWFIRQVGEGLIDILLDPLYEGLWMPPLRHLSDLLGGEGLLHHLLIGNLIDGVIDPEQSFGLLSTGLYVPLVMVLPYIVAFYTTLSFLEDLGYLPRLAVVFDALLHRLGLHGYAIVPTLLGIGCNVPGILATRVLESSRERFIAATLISVAVPCASLQAMIVGSLGSWGMRYVAVVYATLFLSWVVLGRILHKTLPGYSPELVVEIPPYRIPSVRGLGTKLWYRVKDFLVEAIPLVLGGVLLVDLLYMAGILSALARLLAPFFRGVLGLPPEAAGPILLGFLRKDVAVGLLLPLGLTPRQMVVAVVTLAMTFPCIATVIVLGKELGGRKAAASVAIMIATALVAGGALNLVFSLI
ncbi:ferrous iron transporter B [Aminithiophilus ramosus]|uniref:Ferrous iron transporter B n=2 Tax=Synergistales TaxID=649776 RepID=A0A9Q7AM59_9BACT|nr:ferrous iron transporter B [Aminithiophilus ramosus]QTX31933.1 ferrous iron transporter B [Aminithiophilus ramosus]QVL35778.1 ferrous iron transporter B [Synergistota bacterium]